jgi:hypothetical protein
MHLLEFIDPLEQTRRRLADLSKCNRKPVLLAMFLYLNKWIVRN